MTIKSAIAEHARREISYRTRRGMEGLALAGKSTGGRCYGYANAQEATVVKRIFDKALLGESPYLIAKDLNRERIRGPRGPRWDGNSIKRLLSNPRYAGRLEWGATVSQGGATDSRRKRHVSRLDGPLVVRNIEPLVDLATWEKVNGRPLGA